MRKLLVLTAILVLSSIASPLFAQQDNFIEQYVERLENSRKYLLLVAETMPEENYTFKPTPESLSFEEHLMHIAWAMDWHSESLLGGRAARDWDTDTTLKVADKSKAEMMATIDKTFDTAITFINHFELVKLEDRLDYFGADRTKRQILLLLSDHITHHRAQMLVYMRLNQLVPPRYVLFQ
ncbi:DinB family protein [Cellulophaga baltica]|uniref:Damage-inducible protein DinB n=1 Tax=Cellulophaga baltica 18 TaxID=1348584 RepID=A0AAU8RI90_9FLAO|nr:DinB family protein [Cellulophaga baltica]AIZ43029.1 damage-inducible protein DinB [Cellulophaga baltica 18]WFO16508.1 DinB family protein [Cellulophaga baltica 4]